MATWKPLGDWEPLSHAEIDLILTQTAAVLNDWR